MPTLQKESIAWSDWGTYSFNKFISDFSGSEELMKTQLEGFSYMDFINQVLSKKENQNSSNNHLDKHPAHQMGIALYEFARNRIPRRLEDIAIGEASLYNPYRDLRPGSRASIPQKAPDVFKAILEGDEKTGHAVVIAYDQENEMPIDNLLTENIHVRKLNNAKARAVSIINRFPSYVRLMDNELTSLLERIGFMSPQEGGRKEAFLKSIPFGFNMVTFPFEYHETLSTAPVYTIYSTIKAAQEGLKIGLKSSPNKFSTAFFNLEPLAGGTIPRIHMQTYLRTKTHPLETNDYVYEGKTSMRDFGDREVIKLEQNNRSWTAYAPSIKKGRYDIRLELKNQREKKFEELSDIELWDLSEHLACNSIILDQFLNIKERNIAFFPTGVIIRSFAVEGTQEKMTKERIYGQPSSMLANNYNKTKPNLSREKLYKLPDDARGKEKFKELIDESSPIYKISA